jgi:hypothetical protein
LLLDIVLGFPLEPSLCQHHLRYLDVSVSQAVREISRAAFLWPILRKLSQP